MVYFDMGCLEHRARLCPREAVIREKGWVTRWFRSFQGCSGHKTELLRMRGLHDIGTVRDVIRMMAFQEHLVV